MKPVDKDEHVPCLVCGHFKEMHMQVCGNRDCQCLCFLGPEENIPDSWQETIIMSVLDLILKEQEGEVSIRTAEGKECRIQVKYVEGVGHMVSGGRA